MIKLSQVKLPLDATEPDLIREIARLLRVKVEEIQEYEIRKRSLDARKSQPIHYNYVVAVKVRQEERMLERLFRKTNTTQSSHRNIAPQVVLLTEPEYHIPENGTDKLEMRPVVVGSGPAGLFAAWLLAQKGFEPLVVERGADIDGRTEKVHHFWESGQLCGRTNVQFGEGGAGTFSDGKLNTQVKDTYGRIRYMLQTFVTFGADPQILYVNKPHIGTDVLKGVIKRIREEICLLGGEFRFETKVTNLDIKEGRLRAVQCVDKEGKEEWIAAHVLVLAIGHSARDTFHMLSHIPLKMEAKAFAVGVRVEHLQETINDAQYKRPQKQGSILLPAADYKVTHTCQNGRGVYSFCMCPGGYVVNASSETGRLVVNGMSNHARDGRNANSALVVTVTPEDFQPGILDKRILDKRSLDKRSNHSVPRHLAGIEFQRRLEEAAYELAGGCVPVQLYGDFKEGRMSTGFGSILPDTKGSHAFGNVREILPDVIGESLIEGMKAFGKKIQGFDSPEAVFSGIETRTSSPVRLLRNSESLMAEGIFGIYPCGEGAGYAGGITSAAVDGMKVAEVIIKKYHGLNDGKPGGEKK